MSGWLGVAALVAGQLAVSRKLAVLPLVRGRLLAWPMAMVAVWVADLLLAEADPIARMAGICLVLIAGMKAVVYCEWSDGGSRELPWTRHLAFGLLWFGMNPGAFQHRGPRLPGGRMVGEGVALMAVGTLLGLAVRAAGWENVWAVFVPMSVGFHFGALRVLAGLWRLAGFPVKPLFRNPFGAREPAEFWSRRWNLGYSHMMALAVGRPLQKPLGKRGALMAVFVISGLLHELAITLPVRAGFGLPTLCFTLYGFLAIVGVRPWPAMTCRIWTAATILAPLPLLFPAAFRSHVLLPLLRVLPTI